jgi:hypothetical protein
MHQHKHLQFFSQDSDLRQARELVEDISQKSKRNQDKFAVIFDKAEWKTKELTWQKLKLAYNASVYNDAGFLGSTGMPLTAGFGSGMSYFNELYGGIKNLSERPFRHILSTEALFGFFD